MFSGMGGRFSVHGIRPFTWGAFKNRHVSRTSNHKTSSLQIITRLALCCLLAIAPILAYGQGGYFFGSNGIRTYTSQQALGTGCGTSATPLRFNGWIAQSFTASSSYTVTRIDFGLQTSAGSPLSAPVTATIWADTGGSGPGTLLQNASPTETYSLTGSTVLYPWYFSGQALTNGTRYWAGWHGTVDATNYPLWCGNTGGSESFWFSSDGASWTNQATGQLILTTYSSP